MDGRRTLSPIEEWRRQEKEDRKFRLAVARLRAKSIKEGMPNNTVRPMDEHEMEKI